MWWGSGNNFKEKCPLIGQSVCPQKKLGTRQLQQKHLPMCTHQSSEISGCEAEAMFWDTVLVNPSWLLALKSSCSFQVFLL